MKKITLLLVFSWVYATVLAQTATVSFTGQDSVTGLHYRLSCIVISNLTEGWQHVLIGPDTTLVLHISTGITNNLERQNFSLSQNAPNPFNGTTDVLLNIQQCGLVSLEITDINGKVVGMQQTVLEQSGKHLFRVNITASGIFFLTARQNGLSCSIKMLSRGSGGNDVNIEYAGITSNQSISSNNQYDFYPKGENHKPFHFGNLMQYVGYSIVNDNELVKSAEIAQPLNSEFQTVTLDFSNNEHIVPQACPGITTVTDYDNNVYSTMMIGNMCWMKENLRTTHYADGTSANYFVPNNDTSNVPTYGLLYKWSDVMNGVGSSNSSPSGVQGICPDGWHVPSKAEWETSRDYIKHQPYYFCDYSIYNDFSPVIAKALCDTIGWLDCTTDECAPGYQPHHNNISGFSIPPAGFYFFGSYQFFGMKTCFWTSTNYDSYDSYCIGLEYSSNHMDTDLQRNAMGFSVRCVRN